MIIRTIISLLIAFCFLSGYAQVPIDKDYYTDVFFSFYSPKHEEDARGADRFITTKADSLEQSTFVDEVFTDYELSSGVKVDLQSRVLLKSEWSGFVVFLMFKRSDLEVMRKEPASNSYLSEAGKYAVQKYLAQLSYSAGTSLEQLWIERLSIQKLFYEYLASINKNRKVGASYDPKSVGTPGKATWWENSMSKPITKHAYLEISSNVTGCDIRIGDYNSAHKTDVKLVIPISSSNNEVTVQVSKFGYKSYVSKMKLTNGQTTKVKAKLTKK